MNLNWRSERKCLQSETFLVTPMTLAQEKGYETFLVTPMALAQEKGYEIFSRTGIGGVSDM